MPPNPDPLTSVTPALGVPQPEFPYVQRLRRGDRVHLYYRRGPHRIALPGPEGSPEFRSAYNAAVAAAGRPQVATVADALAVYRRSAEYLGLSAKTTRSSYAGPLRALESQLGTLPVSGITTSVTAGIRQTLAGDALLWNRLRSVGVLVWRAWNEPHAPGGRDPVSCPWTPVRRLPVQASDQNRLWPRDVVRNALAGATPEFRALLLALLLTGQRLGDVCALTADAWDIAAGTLSVRQGKTGRPLMLTPPPILADALARTVGRSRSGRLLVTPRGRDWTTVNAQETWAVLRAQLGEAADGLVLHGLRATGISALRTHGGWDAAALMALTGHTTERNLNLYLKGAATAHHAREAASQIGSLLLGEQSPAENRRKFSGVTGRAAAKNAERRDL